MGKGRPRAVEKGGLGLGQNLCLPSTSTSTSTSSSLNGSSLHVPPAPVYYPNEEEFKDPIEYIDSIRAEAEPYGICRIVPPKNWAPPFALNLETFRFPTKTQAIHQLQVRAASCDGKTFELEYNRFLEEHCGKKLKRKVIFEGEELDLCKLFNGVKRFGGYDKVVNHKKWGDVSRFLRSGKKISECAKHVLCQLYREHLYDYEEYYNRLNKVVTGKGSMRGVRGDKKRGLEVELSSCSKRRRKNDDNEKVKVCKKVEIEEDFDQICEQCRSGLHGEVMLLCDRCNKGWHIYCLSPPLKQVPPGNWYCFDCLNSDKETFGFVPGKWFTVEAFRRVADRIRKKWFGSGSTSLVQLEKKFWEIVEGSAGEVEVIYGSDLDTSICGSGFPRVSDQRPESVGAEVWEEYCGIPWNLNNLPKLKGSMLRAVHQNITGVMVPWLYVGMLFSSFCWHFEDHCFYSMNYLHWGEPKCWYSVPGSEASAFEEVMRSSLPDLFEAQPDLLFQLVTMLNPSVLQNHGVPVYSVLQEAGNFVITFPRSYHGGFNLGLNCAEAVNFAPADWLPHGGFGAELYQKYHKTAVLSHEELLCVVAKSDCDIKTSLHLKKELLRVYTKEKSWRERLWKSGIVKSSTMAPRKCPEFVGTEEDPTCMICKQQLYLSAVVCRCRPSVFVCLEHWEHICECKTSRLRLLYRYTLTELYDLVIAVDKLTFKDQSLSNNLQKKTSFSNELNCLTRKVNGGHVSLAQLAEQWLLRASNMFQSPCSRDACAALLKEAEQFLWAGSEMDPVRYMVKNLIAAQKWAGGIRKCLSKIRKFYNDCNHERVQMEYIVELLNFDPLPCNEPGHLKLKEHADEARQLVVEIDSALSSFSKVSELESLYSRVQSFPIYVKESEKLLQKISSVKVWIDSARRCISERRFAAVGVELLYKLKAEISGLQVQLPETEMLLDLLRQAELCQAQCSDILKSPCSLKGVEMLLKELDNFPVNVPELMFLKQCHADVVSWIARYNDVSANAQEREDQDNVVGELNCLMKDGASLRIQVDELPLLEGELKKACCRGKALKARDTKMPMDFIEHLIVEATVLQIEEEKLFVQLSGVLAAAICWEERAKKVLACGAQMSEFEDILRSSADIFAILPSLDDVADTISSAKSWLKSSAPFLVSSSSLITGPCSLLKLDVLKELVSQSKALKISLDEPKLLEKDLKKCEEWVLVACSVLQEAACVLDASNSGDGKGGNLITEIEASVSKLESITESGLSLGLDFLEIPKLQDVCSILRWCIRTLSFCSDAPSIEDAESLMVAAESLSAACGSWPLWSSLIDGVKWLRKALKVISKSSNFGKWKLSDAEEVLAESKCLNISFPLVVDQLTSAIQKHRSWQEQADHFLSLDSDKRYWSLALELKEHGQVDAFSCKELDIILSEVGKVENWKLQCMEIVGNAVDNRHGLLGALEQVKQSLDFSLNIYDNSWSCRDKTLCISCTACIEDQEFQTCSTCNDSYHLRCLDPVLVSENNGLFICHYCHFAKDGSIFQDGAGPLISVGRRPELGMLIELLSDANKISIGIEERDALQHVVEQALKYRTCLREILDLTLSYVGMDASAVSKKLAIALKARKVAGVEDRQSEYDLVLASARNCWRVRVNRLLEGVQKPTLQQIQRHMKAVAMSIPPEDCLWKKLTELKRIGLQWAEQAKKVAADSGVLSLEKVYELILEGENLPIYLEKELELLRARSMLYCICRKPYDRREKVTCDWCGEWYHLDCIKLFHSPKTYVCAACKPQMGEPSAPPLTDLERTSSLRFVEPKTPSPRHTNSKKKADEDECGQVQEKLPLATNNSVVIRASGIDELWWRNRKPFRRAAKKRADLQSLSPFFHAQQQQQQT